MVGIEKISVLRKEKNMTLQQLSDKSGVSLRHLVRIEKEECRPNLETRILIYKALGISDSEIVTYIIENYISHDKK